MLQVALGLPVFLLLMFGIFDLGRLMLSYMALQHAVREGGRFAVTGTSLTNMSRLESIRQTVIDCAEPVVHLTASDIDVSSLYGGPAHAGGPQDVVEIRVEHALDLITPLVSNAFPGGSYAIRVRSVFKNEPFPPGTPP